MKGLMVLVTKPRVVQHISWNRLIHDSLPPLGLDGTVLHKTTYSKAVDTKSYVSGNLEKIDDIKSSLVADPLMVDGA